MQLVSCQGGTLRTLAVRRLPGGGLGAVAAASSSDAPVDRSFVTGLAALDALPPGGAFARGVVHELLAAPEHGTPRSFASLLARAAMMTTTATRGETVSVPAFSDPASRRITIPA